MEIHYSTILLTLFFSLNGLHYNSCQETTSELIVNIKQGALKGQVQNNTRGGEYYSFQGIPYATPPLGQLRFKAPLPPDSWEGTRDATEEVNQCLQGYPNQVLGSEDCLYLNVYTPEPPANTMENLRSVMVWIHGGGFYFGSGHKEERGPDYLLKEDVIVVTINYRLGVLGFLSIDDPDLDAPGNAGLKDAVMALRWVQENIVKFGGNPDDVTIFGESAGAFLVQTLVLSPLAKGLFHKGIMQSSPSFGMMLYREPNCTSRLMELLNVSETNNAKALQIMRELSANELIEIQSEIDGIFELDNGIFILLNNAKCFWPTVEKTSQEPAFLADDPFNIIRSGNYTKVPLVFGFNAREGMLLWNQLDSLLSGTFEDLVPYYLGLSKGSIESQTIAEEIKSFYFGGNELSSETAKELILLLSDIFFVYHVYTSLIAHLQNIGKDMFLYRFSVDGKLNYFKTFYNIDASGALHADELGYLFVIESITAQVIPDSVEDLTIKRMTKLWTNFAKFGNPNPEQTSDLINIIWQPVEENELNFLEIGENLSVGVNPEYVRMKFWDRILNEVLGSYFK